ncbi:hypothetical protein E2562_017080 [Oryza meyeriana var. granulata]|uniref:Uncharacterized protein n=1 Tax=Oryza meyeriana var. granulata TaxID=110450 RepID=A0A6G1F8W6_9ORYZ|nr:hypothetical protein E2562_017080 [Oryza meyeriana var. granulata]
MDVATRSLSSPSSIHTGTQAPLSPLCLPYQVEHPCLCSSYTSQAEHRPRFAYHSAPASPTTPELRTAFISTSSP